MADLWGRSVLGGAVTDPSLPIERNSTNLIAINNATGPYAVTLGPIRRPQLGNASFPVGTLFAAALELGGGHRSQGGGAKTPVRVLLDWPTNGGTFGVAADTLVLDAQCNTLEADRVLWFAWATRSHGRGGLHTPRRSVNYGTLGVPAASNQLLPLFARRVRFMMTTSVDLLPPAIEIRLNWIDNTGTSVNVDIIEYGAQKPLVDTTQSWEVPPTAFSCTVSNPVGSVALTSVRLVYELDLGG